MKVLIAFDSSGAAHVAVELARELRWPEGTMIRLAHVAPSVLLLGGLAPVLGRAQFRVETDIMRAARRLQRPSVSVGTRILSGDDVARAILADAVAMEADLIIVGHGGHGPLATVLLGSVARELVERSRCPVLVARRTRCESLVFAEDGSESAYRARRLLARWPLFEGLPTRVVSVSQVAHPLLSGVAPALRPDASDAQEDIERESRIAYARLADDAAHDLTIAGVPATVDVCEGDPADAIVGAAKTADADLIVMGTRGRSTVERALLGSVARAVVLTAPCSVLVVPAA
jgi:nucleotide-binding universal stress UspA family protein